MPVRIQRSRARGWRKPDNTVIVDRTSRFGNPFAIGSSYFLADEAGPVRQVIIKSNEDAALAFQRWLYLCPEGQALLVEIKENLRGKNICCWCGLDEACHGDTILREANEDYDGRR